MKNLLCAILAILVTGCIQERAWLHKDVRNWAEKPAPTSEADHVLFLVGDAGKALPNDATMAALERQLQQFPENTVAFLGDNLYPVGLRKKDHPERETDEMHLQAQVDAVKAYGKRIVFIPGNHDWEQGGPDGYKFVRRAERFVEKYAERGNIWLPDDGCPGPVEVPLAEDAVLIVIDTQWWLHQNEKPSHEYDCEVKYNADFIEMLEDALERNRGKKIVVAGHHPLYSYGAHGGYFPWQTHLFPFFMAKENNFIPLPVLGTIGVVYRKAWGNIQDIPHPLYQDLKEELTGIFAHHPNVVYVSGHDHNLQYLPVDSTHYIVSGSGSKTRFVGKGKRAQITANLRGFVRLDFHPDGAVWANFFAVSPDGPEQLIYRSHLFTRPRPEKFPVASGPFPDYRDSTVTLEADDRYGRSGFFKAWFGENYRVEWATPIEVPVLDMWSMGLHIEKKGGGHQTKSIRLADAEGRHYVLRSVRKFPELATPEVLRGTFAGEVIQDQISASHPYSALAVPPLAEAAGVLHTNPQIVWLPDDPRLGPYRENFGGGMYLFEERPAGDRSDIASFGRSKRIISTLKMVDKMHEDNEHQVDQQAALRARLFDIWLGDWDRHDDQWRWARFKEDGLKVYRPIPRDRDQVFFRPEGFASWAAMRKWGLRSLMEFDPEIRDVEGYGFAARFWDRNFLTEPSRQDWIAAAQAMEAALTDALIDEALRGFPESMHGLSTPQIGRFMKSRRDHLQEYAEVYYEFLAEEVDVIGSDEEEVFAVDREENGDTRVRMWNRKKNGEKGKKLYDRVFRKKETRSIRLWGMDGDDVFTLEGEARKGIRIRIIMGSGKDELHDNSKVAGLERKTLVYDRKDKKNEIEGGSELRKMLSKERDVNDYDRRAFQFDRTAPVVELGFNIDDGIFLGGGASFRKHRFRKAPFARDEKLSGSIALGSGAFNLKFAGTYPQAVWGWDFVIRAAVRAPNYVQNFYGFGNETIIFNRDDITYHRARFNQFLANPGLRKPFLNGKGGLSVHALAEYTDVERSPGKYIVDVAEGLIDSLGGFDPRFYAGGSLELDIDTRDETVFPTRGFHLAATAGHYQGLNDNSQNFQKLTGELSMYLRFRIPMITVLAARVGGGHSSDGAPFFHYQYLGGTQNLRGYRKERFAGQQAIYQNTELRIQLAEFHSILFPGRFGIVGINDIGRVWIEGEESTVLHWGYGGGIWVTPFEFAAITFSYTGSADGWLPYFSFGWKF
ncbi:MAG: BamA/TamA family outer membrane protein [Bacteroidota bacterium]